MAARQGQQQHRAQTAGNGCILQHHISRTGTRTQGIRNRLPRRSTMPACSTAQAARPGPHRHPPSRSPSLTGAAALRVALVVGLELRLDALAAGQAAARVAGPRVVPGEAVEGAAVPRHHQAQLRQRVGWPRAMTRRGGQPPGAPAAPECAGQRHAAPPGARATCRPHSVLVLPPAARCRCRRCGRASWTPRTAAPTGSGRGTQPR